MKFSEVPVSHDNFTNLLSSLSFLSSTLQTPGNTKPSHHSISLQARPLGYIDNSIRQGLHKLSSGYTECCIHRVLHHWKIHCPSHRRLLSLGGPCCSQLLTYPKLHVNKSTESQHQSLIPPNLLPPDQLAPWTLPILIHHGPQVHL